DAASRFSVAAARRHAPTREDGLEPEVRERVLEIRVQALERTHRGIGDVFEGEADALFTVAERRDGVPQLVTVEGDERTGMRRQLQLDEWATLRVVLEELTHETARRALDEPDEHGVATALVVRG